MLRLTKRMLAQCEAASCMVPASLQPERKPDRKPVAQTCGAGSLPARHRARQALPSPSYLCCCCKLTGTPLQHPVTAPPDGTSPRPSSAAAAAPAANPFAAAAANPFAPAAPAAAAAAAAAPLEKPFYDADDEKVALLLAELEKSRAQFGAEPRLLERLQRVLYAYRKKGNLDSYAFRVRAPACVCWGEALA